MQDWAKWHTDILDNPDVALISPLDYQVFSFLVLLCRREGYTDGRLVGWDNWRLAYRFRKAPEDILASVTRLSRPDVQWLFVDADGVICIPNYPERQYGKPSAAPDQARERKRRQRERLKQASSEREVVPPQTDDEASRASHAAVTPGHATEEKRREEIREEEKREEDTGASAPPLPPETNEVIDEPKAPAEPEDPLSVDLTPGGKTLLDKYEATAVSTGKTNRFKRYRNEQQRLAFEAVFDKLNGELGALIDKGFAHDRARVTDMLSWLEACVKRNETGGKTNGTHPDPRVHPDSSTRAAYDKTKAKHKMAW